MVETKKKKRSGLGCLVVVLAVLVLGGGAAYFFVVRPLTSTVKAGFQLTQLAELDQRVSNKQPFTPPEGDLLSESHLTRYLSVTDRIVNGLEGKLVELEWRFNRLEEDGLSIRQVIGLYSDMISLIVTAKELQVAALNDVGFSLEEYDWVRSTVLQAAGHHYAQLDLAALATGEVEETQSGNSVDVPPANLELVAPHSEQLGEYLILAAFGL